MTCNIEGISRLNNGLLKGWNYFRLEKKIKKWETGAITGSCPPGFS
tara:strand:- start:45 stop:182 length:138 start_codon:yes stop_codon:yes gene_type:complete